MESSRGELACSALQDSDGPWAPEVNFAPSLGHLWEVVNRLLTHVQGSLVLLYAPWRDPKSQVTEKGNPEGKPVSTCGHTGEEEAGLTRPLVSSWARFWNKAHVLPRSPRPVSSWGKKAMLPSRSVAQLCFPEPGTKGQQLYGNGWDATGGVGTQIALTPRSRPLGRSVGVSDVLCIFVPGNLLPSPGLRGCLKPRHLRHQRLSAQTHQALVSWMKSNRVDINSREGC